PDLLLISHYPTAISVRAAHQPGGGGKVTAGQSGAYPSARHTFIINTEGASVLHRKAMTLPGNRQQVEITGAITAKAEIIPHHQVAHTQSFDQHLIDELHGRQAAQAFVERQYQHPVYAALTKQGNLVTQTRQAWWRLITS